MSGVVTGSRSGGTVVELSASAVAWVVAGGLLLLLRLAPIWQAPVAGSEFAHLSGAWSAASGVNDARFVPTLFQALTAGLLNFDAHEAWPRLLSFLATCSVPIAAFRMRAFIGEGTALVFLVLLALSANLVGLGANASAYGFDIPIALWVALAMLSGRVPLPAISVLAFLVATAGPLPLALVLAYALVRLARADYPSQAALVAAGVGAVAGVSFASLGFGWGLEGLVVPPVMVLALSLDHEWLSATTGDLFLLYTWPLALGGAAACTYLLWQRRSQRAAESRDAARWVDVSLVFYGLALLWCVATLGVGTEIPLAALALASAMAAAIPGARLVEALLSADWRRAALPVGLALFFLAIATVVVIDWARFDNGGPAGSLLLSVALVLGGLALLWALALRTGARDAVLRVQDGVKDFAFEAWDGDWRNAALAVIGILAVFAVVAYATVEWASGDSTGRRGQAVVLTMLVLLSAAIVAGMLVMPRLRAAAAAVPIAVALVPLLSGAMLVSLSGPSEPLNSPVSTFQARNLRDIALAQVAERGGAIVVHDSLRADITWPFRDSGDIIIATSVPAEATIVIWPADLPAPPGLVALDGPWSLVRTVPAPTDSFLRYVRWYADRNYLENRTEQIAVYVSASE